jgi:sigma-B regulation protein RsbU (phosphoserine phosphatase)
MEAAVAIENARLYREALERAKLDQELKVAAAIQQSLLPPSSRSGKFFSTAGTSVPCRSVGGDFFDFVDLASGEFGFILGDVAGKGAPAALLAAAGARDVRRRGDLPDPASAARHPAEYQPVSKENRGAVSHRVLRDAGAGRRAHLLERRATTRPLSSGSDSVRRLETGGMVLGLFEHAAFEQDTVVLSPGDVVIAFSDGVSEALNEAGDEYTDERLLASVSAHRGKPPKQLLDGLLADVHQFCGGATPSDDVTLVIVRYEG